MPATSNYYPAGHPKGRLDCDMYSLVPDKPEHTLTARFLRMHRGWHKRWPEHTQQGKGMVYQLSDYWCPYPDSKHYPGQKYKFLLCEYMDEEEPFWLISGMGNPCVVNAVADRIYTGGPYEPLSVVLETMNIDGWLQSH